MSEPDIIDALCDNVSKHYNKIGPMCVGLKDQLKHLKVLQSDGNGALFTVSFISDKEATVRRGVECVGFTYLLWHLRSEMPKHRT